MQTLESLLVEKDSLEKSIAIARVELRVLLGNNNDLRDAIKKQDVTIEHKSQQLKDIKQGNKTSLELVSLERINGQEKWEKELEHKSAQVHLTELNEIRSVVK
jgi:hypothetical protein